MVKKGTPTLQASRYMDGHVGSPLVNGILPYKHEKENQQHTQWAKERSHRRTSQLTNASYTTITNKLVRDQPPEGNHSFETLGNL